MTEKVGARGSWAQRFLIYSLSIVLALLVYWLVGFFLQDLEGIQGPQLSTFTAAIEQSEMQAEANRLDTEINTLQKDIKAVENQQGLLKGAMSNTQNTINQILEIQRLHAQKGQELPKDIGQAFAQNTQLFLQQQNELAHVNSALTQLNLQLLPLENHRQVIGDKINLAMKEANKLYGQSLEKHRLNIGLLQIGVLIFLLLVVVMFLLNKTSPYYRPIWIAISLAVLVKIFFVIHAYFPSRYFKYVLTFSLIMVVLTVLKDLLKKRAFPAQSYLLKQFRDAYEHFLCPVCEFPIRRGPLRYAFWTRRTVKKIPLIQDHTEDNAPYNCPHCGTKLYQPCLSCKQMRHSLLPYCEHCGSESNVAA